MVVACTPWRLNASLSMASTPASTIRKCSGAHPAITALAATKPTVAEEYIGGLVDLTGEVGRFAVARATARDAAAVGRCHAVVDALARRLLAMTLPSKLHKKASALNTNRRKLQALLYDLSIHIRPLASGIEAPADDDAADDE